jgi:hypothetical protein
MTSELTTANGSSPMAQDKDKGGRPTLYTPQTIERLLAGLGDGLSKEQACKAAGIGVSTLRDWMERHPELEPQLAEAREQARQKALSGIKAAGEGGDWRAWESFLRYSFPADYRQGSNIKVEATANAVGSDVVFTEADRQKIIALRERAMARQAESPKLPEPQSEAETPVTLPEAPIKAQPVTDPPCIRSLASMNNF